jgi:hypothetical protein
MKRRRLKRDRRKIKWIGRLPTRRNRPTTSSSSTCRGSTSNAIKVPQATSAGNGRDRHQGGGSHPEQQRASNGDGYPHGEHDTGCRVAFFTYHHADGQPYLGVKKTSTKQFPQYHWNGHGWVKGAPKGPKIPYRLPELIKAPLDALIAAGEKDADTAARLGFVATTNSEGERKGA